MTMDQMDLFSREEISLRKKLKTTMDGLHVDQVITWQGLETYAQMKAAFYYITGLTTLKGYTLKQTGTKSDNQYKIWRWQ